MDLEQREPAKRQVVDVSERKATGELYALEWDRENGRLLALAGPFGVEQLATLDPARLEWQRGPEIAWATQEEWLEQAIVRDEQHS